MYHQKEKKIYKYIIYKQFKNNNNKENNII